MEKYKPVVAMGPDETIIPNLDEMIQDSIKQVGGPKKMEHLLIRRQIITMRMEHEKLAPSHWFDGQYEKELARLRKELQRTR